MRTWYTKKTMSYKKGFTLLEIVIVTAIVIILLAIITQGYYNFLDHQRLNGATESIITLIQRARSLTLASKDANAGATTGDRYGVYFRKNMSPADARVFKGDNPIDTGCSPADCQVPYTFPGSIIIDSYYFPPANFETDPNSSIFFKKITGDIEVKNPSAPPTFTPLAPYGYIILRSTWSGKVSLIKILSSGAVEANSPLPLIIAKVLQPDGTCGSNNRDIEVLRWDVWPNPTYYDDCQSTPQSTEDWFGYMFSSERSFVKFTFTEGQWYPIGGPFSSTNGGGWFVNTPTLQVRKNGVWINVPPASYGNDTNPPYTSPDNTGGSRWVGNNFVYYFFSAPVTGDAIRIIGMPGGSMKFINLLKLEAWCGPPGFTLCSQ